jgi:hypothetical protein
MQPQPAASMSPANARQVRKTPCRWTSIMRSHSASDIAGGAESEIPWLFPGRAS